MQPDSGNDNLPDDPELALARLEGMGAGRHCATRTVDRVRAALANSSSPALLHEMVPALQHGENVGANQLSEDGMSPAEVDQWRIGYFEGADPIVRAFLQECQDVSKCALAYAQILNGVAELETIQKRLGERTKRPALLPGLGGKPAPRPLRPEDLGALPSPPA